MEPLPEHLSHKPVFAMSYIDFDGIYIGKPEPLKHDMAGFWSKRIDDEHRLIYEVTAEQVRIIACRHHY